MFLCDECHDERCKRREGRSTGRCERCSLVTSCLDCHNVSPEDREDDDREEP